MLVVTRIIHKGDHERGIRAERRNGMKSVVRKDEARPMWELKAESSHQIMCGELHVIRKV